MNWGKGLIIAMTLFIGFITFLVIGLVSHKVDLESADYYQQEINYETEIVSLNNAVRHKNNPVILTSGEHVVIQFSNDDYSNIEVNFNRPDNDKEDKFYNVRGTKTFTVSKSEFKPGVYNVELSYKVNGKNCLQKEQIYI